MDLVVFSDDWGRRPSAPQHLFAVLARRHRILWVEPAGLRRPRMTRADLLRSASKLRGFLPRVEPATAVRPWLPQPESLVRIVPPIIPAYGLPAVRRLNDLALRSRVLEASSQLGFEAPVVVTTIPTVAGVVGELGERCSVYWRVDDFSLWPGYDTDAIVEREGVLLQRVDALVASGKVLLTDTPGRQLVLPHGVDVPHFSSTAAECPLPAGGPRLLVAGRLDERIDVDLLVGLATGMPQAELVLLGDALAVPDSLRELSNVTCHPYVPYDELPAWLQAADVLLLPYRPSRWTDSLAPLKVREYLATGRPVVSTPLLGITEDAELRDLVGLASGLEATVCAVNAALAEDPSAGEGRVEALKAMSWEARAESFEQLISLLTSSPL